MQDYINDLSHINNPPEVDFYDSSKDNFLELKSMSEVFEELGMHDDEYQSALKISNGQNFQLHLSRPSNSYFVKNYFDVGFLAWEANIDIKPFFNFYNSVAYICSYLSKKKDQCSQDMKQALTETLEM